MYHLQEADGMPLALQRKVALAPSLVSIDSGFKTHCGLAAMYYVHMKIQTQDLNTNCFYQQLKMYHYVFNSLK